MTVHDEQITMEEINPEYAAFVEKFKPKKTTDDCFTPENVYDAVADWTAREYGVKRSSFVRPFWPGGDYQRYDYPEGCVVVDNPPFSILSRIIAWYQDHGIRFLLFGPSLTLLGSGRSDVCYLVADADITYKNGAVVRTGFLTNLDSRYILRTVPELGRAVEAADKANHKGTDLPKYAYPDCVISAAIAQRLAHYGVEYRVRREDAVFIRRLDAQRAVDKSIFGGGLLLSERAAAERAAAERAAAERAAAERINMITWELSEREKLIQATLGGDNQ